MRTWITAVLKPQYIDDPGRTKYGYIINCWNNRRMQLTPAGEIMVVRVGIGIKIYLSRFLCGKCARQGGRWWCFRRLIYRLRLTRWYWNINQAKTRTNERHETSERGKELWDTANLNQMIFTCEAWAHDAGGSTDSSQDYLLRLEAGRPPRLRQREQFWELARAASWWQSARISPRRWPVFWPYWVITLLLPATDNKKGARYRPFC